jgi:hypothetical protein
MRLVSVFQKAAFHLFGTPRAHRARIKQIVDADDYAARVRQFLHYAKDDESSPKDEPVFILSAGWRSGSTLLQRLLSSSDSLLLWGEPYDRSNIIQNLASTITPFDENWPPRKYIANSETFEQDANQWIANFYPSEARLLDAHRQFVSILFAPNKLDNSGKRWGIKEVRYGLKEAIFLKALYPRAKIIFLQRDLDEAYFSYKNFSQHMNWYARWPYRSVFTPYAFAKHRSRLISEFSRAQKITDGLIVQYKDLTTSEDVLKKLETYCNLSINRDVLKNKVGSALEPRKSNRAVTKVSAIERALLTLGNLRGKKGSLRLIIIKQVFTFFEQRAYLPSAAQNLATNPSNRDSETHALTKECVENTYSKMVPTPDRAQFDTIDTTLLNCTEAEAPSHDECLGVILETRCHPLLERVVVDFINKTGNRVQLFHGKLNLDFIKSTQISALIESKKVILTQLNTEQLDGKTYNAIFLSQQFWHSLESRSKIVVFQTDALLCTSSRYTLSDFTHYDYIGSWWPRKRPVGIVIDGGNGGLSIRDWKSSVTCLEQFPGQKWPGGEDSYFAFHIDLMGGNIARGHDCAKFSTQYKFLFKSFGCHKISCLSKQEQSKFLRYFSDASLLLAPKEVTLNNVEDLT